MGCAFQTVSSPVMALSFGSACHGDATVEELSRRVGIPMPTLHIVDDPHPNAFATGRNPEHAAIALTSGLVELLTERELRSVIAHELAHIKSRDILISTVGAMIASAIALVASAVRWGAMFGGLGARDEDDGAAGVLGTLALAIVAPIAATIVQLAISRSREYEADEVGAEITGDPIGLANALAKLDRGNRATIPVATNPAAASLYIYNPLSGRRVAGWFSTHPPIGERIARLKSMGRVDDAMARAS
jgi:heat shock protein HtpX